MAEKNYGAYIPFRHSEATKRKLSEMRKGAKNPFFGKKHTPEFIARLRERNHLDNAKRTYDISPSTMKIMPATTAAYLAAMIDGEGSITRHHGRPTVSVYNTCPALMTWLLNNVGGSTYSRRVRGRCAIHIWNVASTRNVFECLTAVLPFLVIKQQKAIAIMTELQTKYGDRLNG